MLLLLGLVVRVLVEQQPRLVRPQMGGLLVLVMVVQEVAVVVVDILMVT